MTNIITGSFSSGKTTAIRRLMPPRGERSTGHEISRKLGADGSVIDRRIVAGIDDAYDVEATRCRALNGVHLLARQEQDISRGDGGLDVLRPNHARTVQENESL